MSSAEQKKRLVPVLNEMGALLGLIRSLARYLRGTLTCWRAAHDVRISYIERSRCIAQPQQARCLSYRLRRNDHVLLLFLRAVLLYDGLSSPAEIHVRHLLSRSRWERVHTSRAVIFPGSDSACCLDLVAQHKAREERSSIISLFRAENTCMNTTEMFIMAGTRIR